MIAQAEVRAPPHPLRKPDGFAAYEKGDNMSVKDDLIAARALIDTPENWLRDAPENGNRFCALGACWHIVEDHETTLGKLGLAITKALPSSFVPDGSAKLAVAQFNDAPETTHADIMALFDRAIESSP